MNIIHEACIHIIPKSTFKAFTLTSLSLTNGLTTCYVLLFIRKNNMARFLKLWETTMYYAQYINMMINLWGHSLILADFGNLNIDFICFIVLLQTTLRKWPKSSYRNMDIIVLRLIMSLKGYHVFYAELIHLFTIKYYWSLKNIHI